MKLVAISGKRSRMVFARRARVGPYTADKSTFVHLHILRNTQGRVRVVLIFRSAALRWFGTNAI